MIDTIPLTERESDLAALALVLMLSDEREPCGRETRRELWLIAFKLGLRGRLVKFLLGRTSGLASTLNAEGGRQ